MKRNFVDCFMLMGTALSVNPGNKLPDTSRPVTQNIATNVTLSLRIDKFSVISENLEIDAILDLQWVDPRLSADVRVQKMAAARQIWHPKIIVTNSETKNSNEDAIFWRGYGHGQVLFSEKLTVLMDCTKNYHKFPFDTQFCLLKFGTYRFPHDEVELFWTINKPIEIKADLDVPNFKIVDFSVFTEVDIRTSGNFSIAVATFVLKRDPLHYVYCIFMPCIVSTALNYLTIWFQYHSHFKRQIINALILSFTLFLYFLSVCKAFEVPYLKALDIFVSVTNIFALLTLLESIFSIDMWSKGSDYTFERSASKKSNSRYIQSIEFFLKLSYPVFYCLFIILYGFYYLSEG